MDAESKSLKREGMAAMKRGDRAEAHRLFTEMVKRNPNDPIGLVFAGVTAPTDQQTRQFLHAAGKAAPDHPAVRRGWKWVELREKKSPAIQPASRWAARDLQKKLPSRPGFLLLSGGTFVLALTIIAFFLLLVLGTFYYLNILRPAAIANFIPTAQTLTPALTSTLNQVRTASLKPTQTHTQAPATKTPTPVHTASPTKYMTSTLTLSPIEATDTAYPAVSYASFYAAPEQYAGNSLRLTGIVVGYGEARLDESMAFALLLGPPPGEDGETDLVRSPVLVLGIAPDAAFDLDVVVTVYGLGGEAMDSLAVQGVAWTGPVFLAEGYNDIDAR